jgi:nanoRNase/pAp phosphatase (c-di-AMP/oligoRNAs hydrolase)
VATGTNGGRSSEAVGRLKDVLSGAHRLVIVGHDNPDPDYLASAMALRTLARELAGISTVITMAGVLGRAENRAMVRLLRIRLQPLEAVHVGEGSVVAMIDTQPRAGNNSVPRRIRPRIVLDHHPRLRSTVAPLVDIRVGYGATSTILAEYLQAAGIEPAAGLATALAYGIASETLDLSREASVLDTSTYLSVLARANKPHLAAMMHPKVPRYYFAVLARALREAFYYRNVIGARLGDVAQPDVIGQTADLLLTHERMSWAICTGFYNETLLVSARSATGQTRLGGLLRRLVANRGTAGGHEHAAAAQIPCRGIVQAERLRLEESILMGFMRLISRQETVEPRALIPPVG